MSRNITVNLPSGDNFTVFRVPQNTQTIQFLKKISTLPQLQNFQKQRLSVFEGENELKDNEIIHGNEVVLALKQQRNGLNYFFYAFFFGISIAILITLFYIKVKKMYILLYLTCDVCVYSIFTLKLLPPYENYSGNPKVSKLIDAIFLYFYTMNPFFELEQLLID